MALFSITGETLHDALANVLPHASKDGTLPVLVAVQVTVEDDGLITFAATDRFTLGVAEVASDKDAAVEPGSFLLPRDVALGVAKLAKSARGGLVTVLANESAYTVEVRGFEQSTTARLEMGEFPKWRSLWPSSDPVEIPRIGLGANQLAKFAKLYRDGRALKMPTLTLTFRGPAKAVVVTATELDDFRALVMPVRLAGVK